MDDDKTTMAQQAHAPPLSPPHYEYKERLLVAPVVRNAGGSKSSSSSSSSSFVNWFLRFETHQQLVTTSTTTEAQFPFFSPFPDDIPALLKKFGAVRILIQASNLASSSFPSSPLDTPIPPLGQHVNASGRNDDSVTNSPAGVRIMVEFFQEKDHQGDLMMEDRFVRLLQEISGRRWILASLASVQEPRLHRIIHQEEAVQPHSSNSNNSTLVRMSIMLPTDGHALSAEAMQSFTTALNPCSTKNSHNKKIAHAGLWSLVNPMTWSSLLLGNEASTHGVHGRRGRRRGFWIDIRRQQNLQHQRYSISQGLYYSRATTKAAAEGISLRELLSVETTAPTDSWWKSCHPLADDTSLVVIAPDPGAISTSVSASSACQQYQRSSSPATLEFDMSFMDMTSKCLEVTSSASPSSSSSSSSSSIISRPLWQVHLDLQRPAGVARHGTILTTVLNHDVDSSAHVVSALQLIPPVIAPIWHSLKLQYLQAATMTTTGTSPNSASFPDPIVDWKADGTMVLSFAGTLPANTAVQLELDYDPVFLPFEQFPADANRGFDLPPVQAHMRTLACNNDTVPSPTTMEATLYSDSVTLLAPLPDRSMPFNVLSLSCTLFAFILGSLVNILVRKSSERVKYTLYPDQKPKSKLKQVKAKLQARFKMLRQKLLSWRKSSSSSTDTEQDKEDDESDDKNKSAVQNSASDDDDQAKEKME